MFVDGNINCVQVICINVCDIFWSFHSAVFQVSDACSEKFFSTAAVKGTAFSLSAMLKCCQHDGAGVLPFPLCYYQLSLVCVVPMQWSYWWRHEIFFFSIGMSSVWMSERSWRPLSFQRCVQCDRPFVEMQQNCSQRSRDWSKSRTGICLWPRCASTTCDLIIKSLICC